MILEEIRTQHRYMAVTIAFEEKKKHVFERIISRTKHADLGGYYTSSNLSKYVKMTFRYTASTSGLINLLSKLNRELKSA